MLPTTFVYAAVSCFPLRGLIGWSQWPAAYQRLRLQGADDCWRMLTGLRPWRHTTRARKVQQLMSMVIGMHMHAHVTYVCALHGRPHDGHAALPWLAVHMLHDLTAAAVSPFAAAAHQ